MLCDYLPAIWDFPAANIPCCPPSSGKMRGPGNSYDIGSTAVLTATFKNAAGYPVDPTLVTLRLRDPQDNVTVYTYQAQQLTRLSIGVYAFNLPLPVSGTWFYRFEGSGFVNAASDSYLQVTRSKTLGY